MTRKQTSPRLSSLAARYIRLTEAQLADLVAKDAPALAAEIRSLAASVLAQDETK